MGARDALRGARRTAKGLIRPLVAALSGDARHLAPERWGLTSAAGRGLLLDGVRLHDLLEEWGSPLHVVNRSRLRENARRFRAHPSGAAEGCEIFYSYKTNPIEGVLRELHAEGLGAEVISPYELWLAEQLGVPPDRTIYNGPGKSDDSLRSAILRGIQTINCNHREEVGRVARLAREVGRRARVGIRVSTDASWTGQFGTPLAGGQALEAFREARASGVLDVVGLHAHRGGMLRREAELSAFLAPLLAFVEELERELSLRLEILNFGGSLGTPTVEWIDDRARKQNRQLFRDLPLPDADAALSIERYLELLTGSVEADCRRAGRPRPRIVLEPGRSVTADAQFLLARVITTKVSDGAGCLVLDAGINLAESVRSEYHQLLPVARYGEPLRHVHSVVGPICSPMDTLYPAVRLPALEAGDSLAIMDAGAYFVPFSTSFSYPRPAVVLLDGGKVTLLRRRETFDDLARYDREGRAGH